MNQIAQAIIGAGSIRLAVYNPDTQAWGALGDPMESDKFEITPQSDQKRKTSKSRGAYGQGIATVSIAQPTQIAIALSAASAEAMAMQFQGIVADVSHSSGTLDDTVAAKLDKWAKLSFRNLNSTGFAVKQATGETPVTFALGTDYLVNYVTGEIKPLSTGAIEANESLKVTGTALAFNETVIRGGTRAQVRVRAVWEGENMVDNQYIEVEAYEAVLTSSAGFDFLADDFNSIELSGELVVPSGKTEPYVVRFKNAA